MVKIFSACSEEIIMKSKKLLRERERERAQSQAEGTPSNWMLK